MNTNYWRNKIMTSAYSSPNTFYVGLSSTQPTAAGGNVSEPSGNGYSRVQATFGSSGTDGEVTNTAAITFPRSSGTWFSADNLASYWVVYDGTGSGAHLLSAGSLSVPIGIWENTQVSIASNEIVITLTDA